MTSHPPISCMRDIKFALVCFPLELMRLALNWSLGPFLKRIKRLGKIDRQRLFKLIQILMYLFNCQ
jgi:hypothetical protein